MISFARLHFLMSEGLGFWGRAPAGFHSIHGRDPPVNQRPASPKEAPRRVAPLGTLNPCAPLQTQDRPGSAAGEARQETDLDLGYEVKRCWCAVMGVGRGVNMYSAGVGDFRHREGSDSYM